MGENGLDRHAQGFHELILVKQQGASRPLRSEGPVRGGYASAAGVGDDLAVLDFDDSTREARDMAVVGDHDNGMSLGVEPHEDVHDVLAAFGVQGAGGLVGQYDFAAVHQGAGDAHPLLLPA